LAVAIPTVGRLTKQLSLYASSKLAVIMRNILTI
jgi:hypothetical protein